MADNEYDPMSYGAIRFNGEEADAAKDKADPGGDPEDMLFGSDGDAVGDTAGVEGQAAYDSEWEMPDDVGHPLAGGGPDANVGAQGPAAEQTSEFGAGRSQFEEPRGPLAGPGNAPEASLEDLIGSEPTVETEADAGWEPLDQLPGLESNAPPPPPATPPAATPPAAATPPSRPVAEPAPSIPSAPAPAPAPARMSPSTATVSGTFARGRSVQQGHTGDTSKKVAAVGARSKLDMMAMMARRRQRARVLAMLGAAGGLAAGAWFYFDQGQEILGGIAAGLGVIGGLFLFTLMKD